MINPKLIGGAALGSCKLKFNCRHSSVSISAALALAMSAGCSNILQNNDAKSFVETNATTVLKDTVSELNIKGKPTKTIETPWGPREVYDPTQDISIREAAEYIYEHNKTPLFYSSYSGLHHDGIPIYFPKKEDIRFRNQEALISIAVRQKRIAYHELGCKRLVESVCGMFTGRAEEMTEANKKKCKGLNPENECLYRMAYGQANSFGQCSVGEETAFNRGSHPLGKSFISKSVGAYSGRLPETPNFAAQFKNLFLMHCNNWNSNSNFKEK